MPCLGIDTSGETLSVGLSDGGRVMGERHSRGDAPHSVKLLAEIEALLADTGTKRTDISLVAVTGGPGRYTALRVGMATAKGLAFALNIPMVRVSALEAMALSLQSGEGRISPLLDARRRLVYCAVFEVKEGHATRLAGDRALPYREASDIVPDGTILTGDGVPLVEPFLAEKGVTFEVRPCMIHGGIVARLGEERFASYGTDEIYEGPTYVRKVEVHGGAQPNLNG